ncbi:MAG: hypothetical protein K0U98_13555 [Deltaproteobacteria bacterium]|nr:hypothetical protein [Deltaproteobacteria bacterium]
MFLSKRGFVSLLRVAALAAVFLAPSAPPALATAPSSLEVHLDPPPRLTTQETLSVTGTVRLNQSADTLRLTYEGEGSLAMNSLEETLPGPWRAGDRFEFGIDAHGRELGQGRLIVTLESLDEKGRPQALHRAYLYGLVEEARIWTSISSWTDLGYHRAESLFRKGEIDPQQYQNLLDRLITGRSVTSPTPLPAAEKTAHSRWLEQTLRNQAEHVQVSGEREQVLEAAPAATILTTNIEGTVRWTDSAGNVHSVPEALVEIYKPLASGEQFITETRTNAEGFYEAQANHDDSETDQLFVRVLAESTVARLRSENDSRTYRLQSEPFQAFDGATFAIPLTAGNDLDSDKAFGLHHGLVLIGAYASKLAGSLPDVIEVRFPGLGSGSKFQNGKLFIEATDAFDWDVLHHEYGHYFQAVHGFVNSPGGIHSITANLSNTPESDTTTAARGKDKGIRLAWSEGWVTFFGIRGQVDAQASSLGIPNVGDVSYHETDEQTFNVNLETCFFTRSINGDFCVGEDNEFSVAAALWDLVDSTNETGDRVDLTDKRLFEIFKVAAPTTVGAAWEALAAAFPSTSDRVDHGSVFGLAHIAPQLNAPPDNLILLRGDPPPTFRWLANGGGTPNPLTEFRVSFYSETFEGPFFQAAVSGNEFTPSQADMDSLVDVGGPIRWVIEGRSLAGTPLADNPPTPSVLTTPPGSNLGHYWSGFRTLSPPKTAMIIDDTGSMGEEINRVRGSLASFIDRVEATLPEGEAPPSLALLTFKDNVTRRIASNDVEAVRAAVNALSASGGGDCPEFSAQALEAAATSIGPGGTVVLATDASSRPGVNLGALIQRLRAIGVSVNTILSGDCEGIDSLSSPSSSDRVELSLESQQEGLDRLAGNEVGGDQEEPPLGPIDVPEQAPLDAHGDSPELATTLLLGEEGSRGILVADGTDLDFFRFTLEQGLTYRIDMARDGGAVILVALLDLDGATVLQSRRLSNSSLQSLVFTPTESGTFFLRVVRANGTSPAPYEVSVREDAFALLSSAVEMFSTISQQTGGVFLVRDGVNSGQQEEYEAALFNVLLSSVQPAVLASNPGKLPRSSTLAVELNGRGTNWRASSTVSFTGEGIEVLNTEARSATSLTAFLQVDPAASTGFRNVEVVTPLGSEVEVAFGQDVIEVTGALSSPTLLSVEPSVLERGTSTTVLVRGLNTAWDVSSTLSLGSSITVSTTTVLSNDLLEAQVAVSEEAPIGFRTAAVTTAGFGTQSKSRALFVSSGIAAIAEILAVSPEQGSTGETLTVTVTGLNSQFEEGLTIADFGAGIETLEVEVLSPEEARVTIAILPDANLGFQDVSLTTNDEVAVRLNGFFIQEGGQDEDDDGVPDELDLCPGTLVPEGVPTVRLGTNRWALVDNDGQFDTRTPGNRPPTEAFSLLQTGGCSCEQIIEQRGLGQGHRKFGCSTGVMRGWVGSVTL